MWEREFSIVDKASYKNTCTERLLAVKLLNTYAIELDELNRILHHIIVIHNDGVAKTIQADQKIQ